jgi:hypothetical protein
LTTSALAKACPEPRRIVAEFSGGHVSTDGGLSLFADLDRSLGLTRKLSRCFHDHRDQRFVEHGLQTMLAQRLHGLAAGYEDLNDHFRLRLDPLLAVVAGHPDPEGQDRSHPDQHGKPLAAPATLNRLELTNTKPDSRYHKIVADHAAIEELLLALGVGMLAKDTTEVILDFDATGTLLYGHQEGRHFNAYYDDYCYLPLLIYIGQVPVWAQLRTSDHEAAAGAVEVLKKVVAAVRARCPQARIIRSLRSGRGPTAGFAVSRSWPGARTSRRIWGRSTIAWAWRVTRCWWRNSNRRWRTRARRRV